MQEKAENIDNLNETLAKLKAKLEMERELLVKAESELKRITKRYENEIEKNK